LRRLTAAQNVALPLRYLGLSDTELRVRVRDLLDRVGMLHRANHYPAQLSGGQRQRIGIARGLALQPSVLLSDEATSGLDPDATRSILDLLTGLRDDLGVTILVITHEMDVVRTVADVVAHLDHGRIVESGAVADVVRRSDSTLSRALLPLPPAPAEDTLRTWRLRYAADAIDPRWLARAGRELGTDIAVLAALVEEAGHEQVGRLTVGVDAGLEDRRVAEAFARQGVRAARPAGDRMTALVLATPWGEVPHLLLPALGETALMVGIVMAIVVALGLPLGLLIFNTSPGGLAPNRTVNASISWIANLGRSLPFLVLMAAIIPFTRFVVGTTIGIQAAIIPMSLAGIAFFARLVENAVREIPRELLDVGRPPAAAAGRSCAASSSSRRCRRSRRR
jgi:D-methionine transport system ATP-binding protein